jgi:hypothetical protein
VNIVLEGNVRRKAVRSESDLVDASFDELGSLSPILPNISYHRNTQIFQCKARASELMFASLVVATVIYQRPSNTIVLRLDCTPIWGPAPQSYLPSKF